MLVAARRTHHLRRSPQPNRLLHAGVAVLAVVSLIVWLQALGRPLFCRCEAIRLWGSAHDSQHLSDWYSLLHVSFGFGLFALTHHFQPRWPASLKLLVTVFSSALWEAIENLPFVIALFAPPTGGPRYAGDTVLNALGDTIFVIGGAWLAAHLSLRTVLLAAVAIEIAVWLAIGDGIVIGSARLLAA